MKFIATMPEINKNNIIPVTKTYLPNIEKYQFYIEKIYKSGWLTNNGELVRELEKRLTEYLGVKYLILVANGTFALQITYKLLYLKGDVITTPFSFVATTSSLIWEGLNPLFVDIKKDTLNIDPEKIENIISPNTSAILPVHIFGNVCEIDEIQTVAQKNKLKVIYDASHAFGVKYKNSGIGNFGDIATFSFHSTKIFHTIEGGAIIVNNKRDYDKAKLMINFGFQGPEKITGLGINCKMNEFQAAMGLCVLDDFKTILSQRKNVYDYYKTNLQKNIHLEFQKQNEFSSNNYSYFPVIFRSEQKVIKVQKMLMKENIFPRRYFFPSLESLDIVESVQNVPNSSNISKRILCLPLYEGLKRNVQDRIISITNKNS